MAAPAPGTTADGAGANVAAAAASTAAIDTDTDSTAAATRAIHPDSTAAVIEADVIVSAAALSPPHSMHRNPHVHLSPTRSAAPPAPRTPPAAFLSHVAKANAVMAEAPYPFATCRCNMCHYARWVRAYNCRICRRICRGGLPYDGPSVTPS